MGKFALSFCVAALLHIAAARPDLSLGYKYHQGHSSGGADFLQATHTSLPISAGGSGALSSTSYTPTASGTSYFNTVPAVGFVGNSGFVPSTQVSGFTAGYPAGSNYNAQYNTGGASQPQQQQYQTSVGSSQSNYDEQQAYLSHLQNHQPAVVTKHFYVHSAPIDHDEEQVVRYVNVGRPQKNYRVVFIDAPSSTVSKAKIIANVAPVEDKTAIYVLSKKTNALDVSAEVVTQAPVNHKPEVFFIKYKTPEEAVHAQHTIQAQYDSLGGTSETSNEGQIPVSSVIGSLGGHDAGASGASTGFSGVSVGSGPSDGGSNFGGFSNGEGGNNLFNAESSQNVGSTVAVAHTGDNTQQTYLPSLRRYRH